METQTQRKTYNILLVEDDINTNNMYSERIGREIEFNVIKTYDGLEGLKKLNHLLAENIPVDLVFTGIEMPNMSGFDLIEAMRKNSKLSSIPTMISSHLGRPTDFEKAKRLGVKHFIVRGETTPNQVVRIIKEVLIGNHNSSYNLKINPHSEDYKKFVKDFFGFECDSCSGEDRMPVKVSLVQSGKVNLFSIEQDCNRCKKKI